MQYLYIVSKNNIYLDEIYSQISYAIDTQKFTDLVQIVEQFVKLYSRQSNQVYKIIFSHKVKLLSIYSSSFYKLLVWTDILAEICLNVRTYNPR